jgi:aminoglycoside phosphotransferase (APT) family kinase protein
MAERLREQLRRLAATVYEDDGATIASLEPLTGGASRETWSFDVQRSSGAVVELILRRDPPAANRGMALEAAALGAARRAGVPEPEIVFASDDPAHVDAPCIVMERVAGETLARRILRDDAYADARPRLAGQCGEILARIHAIDAGELAAAGAVRVADPVAELAQRLAAFAEPRPALELGLRWLHAHRPPPNPPGVVHGDFRLGNLMVGPDGIRAVLDWELVHIGDPLEDLGYLCVRAWRFGGPGPVGGFGDHADLLAGYERAGGGPVDLDAVRWWELLGTVWWGVTCMVQASRHLSGETPSIELAAIGRRTVEQEYDTLMALGELA